MRDMKMCNNNACRKLAEVTNSFKVLCTALSVCGVCVGSVVCGIRHGRSDNNLIIKSE